MCFTGKDFIWSEFFGSLYDQIYMMVTGSSGQEVLILAEINIAGRVEETYGYNIPRGKKGD